MKGFLDMKFNHKFDKWLKHKDYWSLQAPTKLSMLFSFFSLVWLPYHIIKPFYYIVENTFHFRHFSRNGVLCKWVGRVPTNLSTSVSLSCSSCSPGCCSPLLHKDDRRMMCRCMLHTSSSIQQWSFKKNQMSDYTFLDSNKVLHNSCNTTERTVGSVQNVVLYWFSSNIFLFAFLISLVFVHTFSFPAFCLSCFRYFLLRFLSCVCLVSLSFLLPLP